MQNKMKNNYGSQTFTQNIYGSQAHMQPLSKISDEKYSFPFWLSIVATIISFLADMLTVILAYNDFKKIGLNMMSQSGKVTFYSFLFIILSFVFLVFLLFNFNLLRSGFFNGFKKKGKDIVKVKPKECPICGGKMKLDDCKDQFRCNRNKKHIIRFDYTI